MGHYYYNFFLFFYLLKKYLTDSYAYGDLKKKNVLNNVIIFHLGWMLLLLPL